MHWIRSLAVSVAAMLFSGTALASGISAVIFDEDTGLTGPNQDQSVGWEFNVDIAFTVTGLQWYDDGGNGLTISHEVGLWDPLGVLLAVTFIPAETIVIQPPP